MNSRSLIFISTIFLVISTSALSYDEKIKRHPSPEDIISVLTVHKHRWHDFSNKTQEVACAKSENKTSCINDFIAYKRTKIQCELIKKRDENISIYDLCMIDIESKWLRYKQQSYDNTGSIPDANKWQGYCTSPNTTKIRICR